MIKLTIHLIMEVIKTAYEEMHFILQGLLAGYPTCCIAYFVSSQYASWGEDKERQSLQEASGADHILCDKCLKQRTK